MIALIGVEATPPPGVVQTPEQAMSHVWRMAFKSHGVRNKTAANMLRSFTGSEESKRDVEAVSLVDEAETYAKLRERCTYVDSVKGRERWSLPETQPIDRKFGVAFLRMVRKMLGRTITAARAAAGHMENASMASKCSPDRLRELHEWSESSEAVLLSNAELEENRAWAAEADAALARISGE